MSDEKNPLEQAVDQAVEAFVYAPIGLLFDGPALFPKLVERGKSQVNVARMMGKMAVQMGQVEAGKRLSQTQGPVREALETVGLVQPRPRPTSVPDTDTSSAQTEPAPAEPKPASQAKPASKTKVSATVSSVTKAAATSASTSATKAKSQATKARAQATKAAASLGIPDYDSLSASQVVTRLRGLAANELDAVKAYEATTRARKTILNRIVQLQKD